MTSSFSALLVAASAGRNAGDADRLRDLVTFRWKAVGLGILLLGADGRIVSDFQFIES
ncbi:hypothetical protein AB0C12_18010 [Actinoplanes sp. NPDC048967]|uniref:hypothetical protein n=1 Tax=Actinoplanes sp. NPDC048967 TaxID=3155269 RepID=UPI0033D8C6B6